MQVLRLRPCGPSLRMTAENSSVEMTPLRGRKNKAPERVRGFGGGELASYRSTRCQSRHSSKERPMGTPLPGPATAGGRHHRVALLAAEGFAELVKVLHGALDAP